MKNLVSFLLAFIMLTAFSTDSFAQKKIKFDREGKATISTTVKANSKVIYYISGKDFTSLFIKQNEGDKFTYELRRGSEFLSSGHTTGSNITLSSDGESTYSLIVMNTENKIRVLSLSIMQLRSEGNK